MEGVGPTVASDEQEGWGVGVEIENSILVRTSYGLICTVGIIGNLLVCLVMLRVPSLRSNTSDFLVHLAIVDFMTCLWAVLFHLFTYTPSPSGGWGGEIRCRMFDSKFPLWTSMLVSVFNLAVVNLQRYVAIVHPHKYKTLFQPRNKYLILLGCWCLALLCNWYYFIIYDVFDGTTACLFVGWGNFALQAVAGVYIFTAYLLAPLSIMVITQWRVISSLNQQVKQLKEKRQRSDGGQEVNHAKERQMWQLRTSKELQKTLLVVIIAYVVCWTPTNVVYFAFNLGAPVNFAAPYFHFCAILSISNSCINPIIYTMKNRSFRKGIKQLFWCSCGAGGDQIQPQGTDSLKIVDVIEVAGETEVTHTT
ncbi:galanin receptor type 1-like [Acanthaster planci]|uniref:Galanin receptor type 1-like n=1 Tax=Acanthaster planci TaxID=133434 RepID=A0A8B7ZNW3_ACAPL|nr:galanin receptor type 1-like [Acanthaster planci]